MHPRLEKQNAPELIKLLKASSVAYTKAKSREFLFTYLLIFLSIAYPTAYIFIKDDNIKYGLFIVSFLVTIFTWLFADYFKGNTVKGAIYKEKFDVSLFDLPWKFTLAEPDMAEVSKLSRQYKREDIKDWYPTIIIDNIPGNTVIAICQRINSNWDIELRSKFKNLLISVLVVYTVAVFLLWTFQSVDGRTVFSIYFSTLSYYSHLISLYRGNSTAIKKQRILISKLDSYINHRKKFTKENLRDVQDEIYYIRQEPSKVPTSFFRIYNKKLKEECEDYIQDINLEYATTNKET